MSDSKSEVEGKLGKTAEAVAQIAKSVPVYQDAIQPAAKEVGKSLQLVVRAVNVALLPVEGLVWGVDEIKDFVRQRVAEKLKNIPPEDVQQPKPHIAVPAIEALRYTGAESDLSELYANLLATSMDKVTAYRAHPAFVDMIKNMSPDEAKLIRHFAFHNEQPLINIKLINKERKFWVAHRHVSLIGTKAGCSHVLLTSNYLDNLERLGLISIPTGKYLAVESVYKEIEDHPQVKKTLVDLSKKMEHTVELERLSAELTDLGKQFIRACVIDKASNERN